ncbi:MAG: hypothetical protein IT225_10065 [Flavobacteriales bacterium]|jgi:ABC-type transport system involved in Fe-S cluster assembly fused permease/ATPase subunit|nr:hypothetical protein [Flavobacteriales bacterium]
MKELIIEILKTNPGIGTVTLTAVILPLTILWMTNRQNRKLKERDHENELKRAEFMKNLDSTATEGVKKADHERLVYSSLVKILFDVQTLHIALSGTCVDYKCVDDAIEKFRNSFAKYQEAIADNQLFLSSKVTNLLYRFYQILGQVMIDLKNLKDQKQYELAVVCVYESSQSLANQIIEIQDEFNRHRKDVQEEFTKADLSNFRQCCGQAPSEEWQRRFKEAKDRMSLLSEPHAGELIASR